MNNIFDIKRFGLVFRKDLMEGWKRYSLLFLTMIGIIAVVLTWSYWDHYSTIEFTRLNPPLNDFGINHIEQIRKNHELEILRYLSFMFGGFGLLFAATFMNPMNSKLKKITYLVSPSSSFEKYFSRWIIVTVAYIISFFIAMWIADALRVGICSARYPMLDVAFVDLAKLVHWGSNFSGAHAFSDMWLFFTCLALYFLFQSLFVLGSTFWEKTSFVKTFTAGALIVFLYVMICRWAILLFYGNLDEFFNVPNSFESLRNIEKEQGVTIMASVMVAFTLLNWTLAFFRFRESEIIKRL